MSDLAHAHGVLLTVAYDGTAYSGWAPQEGSRTIAGTLAGAIAAMDPTASPPRGASRTDAGVHAEGQLAAFDSALEIDARGWVLGLNSHLPDDVAVRSARAVNPGYNPRFFAKKKRYRYRLLLDRVRDPLLHHRAWRVGFDLDRARFERECARLLGTHDFAAFRSSSDERAITERTLDDVRLDVHGDRDWSIVVEGSAFMHNMVRIIAGTLVDVARAHLDEGAVTRAMESKQRGDLGSTAPAHGLTLEWIVATLPENAGDPWPQ